MNKKVLYVTLLSLTMSIVASAQGSNDLTKKKDVYIGLGTGMDYGGLGIKAQFYPLRYLGIFGGGGYNFYSLGANAGLTFRPLPKAKIQPLLLVSYGYNGAINIDATQSQLQIAGLENVSRNYFGFTTGILGGLKVGKKGNQLQLGVLYPFRNKIFRDNYEKVQNSPFVEMKSKLLSVTFSLGFNWKF